MSKIDEDQIVVAIGASAGGLQALTELFDNIPEETPYSFIIVQHLSPDYESLTDELLSKKTKIPIKQASENEKIKKNHIYVIPSSKNLIIEKGRMVLVDKPTEKKLNLPIDIFFESLAYAYKQHAVGIIVSGTGSDGSSGLKFIKSNGGVVIAQQPDQAKFDGMPQSAINTDLVDYILPVEEMYSEIFNYFSSPDPMELSPEKTRFDEKKMKKILDLLEEETDLDFNQYKKPTLVRRMSRRIKILQLESLESYYEYLQDNPEEIEQLYKDFLIGVTKFFRDKGAWEVIRKHVVPELIKFQEQDGTLKIWDVGCNTGEEAYSLAMLLMEECEKQQKNLKLKIFATDISQDSLNVASKGVYEANNIADLDNTFVAKYFSKQESGNYKVVDRLRRVILFTPHNILKDAPFNNIDFCLCRNLLIYLQNPVQLRVLKVLHYSLKFDGFLMLGNSENLGTERNFYEEISRKWKIYRNIKTTERSRNKSLSAANSFTFDFRDRKKTEAPPIERSRGKRKTIDTISLAILKQFNATTIQVDKDFRIIEAQGMLGRYAHFPENSFKNNLLEILPQQLLIPIKTAVNKAKKSNLHVIFENNVIDNGDENRIIDIRVLPVYSHDDMMDEEYMITLIEKDARDIDKTVFESVSLTATAEARISDLEQELEETKLELNRALEETETSNEELQASNEELLASNEELQSTNEELQSVNEELHTVNNDHIQKLEELANLNTDVDNLLNSTKIGVVYLDKNLRIRKFTPAVKVHFNLLKQDIGRHIDNFVLNLKNSRESSLIDMVKEVMESGNPIDMKVISKNNRNFLMRINPFSNRNKDTDGVVITFTDIEEMHQFQVRLNASEKKFKDFYESDPIMHASININTGMLLECNEQFYKNLGFNSKKDVLNKSMFDFYTEASRIKASELLEQLRQNGEVKNEEITMKNKKGEEIPMVLNSNLKMNEKGVKVTRSTLLDISKLKSVQKQLENRQKELEQANLELEQFVSICSHDLQEPLTTIHFSSDIIRKNFDNAIPSKAMDYVTHIHEASKRMSEQINALLEHSKLGSSIEKTEIDINKLLDIVKRDLSGLIEASNARISFSKMPTLVGYKSEMRLLFQNLFSNAIKYAKKDTPPDIRCSVLKDDDFYVFSVSDNGKGISEKDIDRIFKIFSRVDNNSSYVSGTGIGLAHCVKIAKLHNGKIWADSQLGVGSTFHIKIKV